jgi:eukaryotic-like serine/threonine-protein kinase
MEFLRGESLRDAIKNQHTGDLRSKLNIALQISRSLDYIHSKRIIHRDIKPDNIHLDLQSRVKLMDFGIAKSHNVALTRVGFTLGTPYYMAPEQVLGQQVTPLVDVYAFGILLFELFTGTKPIGGDSIDKVFMQILQEPLNLEPLRQAGAPQSVVELVERCTAKMPQQRIQGFGAIIVELERMIEELTPTATPDRTGLGPAVAPVSAKWETPAPPAAPRAPITRPSAMTPAPPPPPLPQPQAQQQEALPGFMQILPAQYRTQEWFIGIVAVGVICGMVILVLMLRLVLRVVS